jgi:hypothetical protein
LYNSWHLFEVSIFVSRCECLCETNAPSSKRSVVVYHTLWHLV